MRSIITAILGTALLGVASCAPDQRDHSAPQKVLLVQLNTEGIDRSKDPCENLSTPNANARCGYDHCDQDERVRIACDFKHAVLDHYSGLFIKNLRLPGFNSNKHLQDCVDREAAISDNDQIAFIDRMTECVAGFQDTHFSVDTPRATPIVYVPIDGKKIQDKVFVVGRLKSELQGDQSNIELGDEILEIDGVPVLKAADTLKRFISASSESYRSYAAVKSLFSRWFSYPTAPTMKIRLRKSDGKEYSVDLPWMYPIDKNRPDTNLLFSRVRIHGIKNQSFDSKGRKKYLTKDNPSEVAWEQRSFEEPLFEPAPGEKFSEYSKKAYGEDRSLAIRTGLVEIDGKKVGYLQLLTYSSWYVYDGPDRSQQHEILDLIRDFVIDLKNKGLDLVFDLRVNNGGDPFVANSILSILTEAGKTYGGDVSAARTSDSFGNYVWRDKQVDLRSPEKQWTDLFGPAEYSEVFKAAYASGKLTTPLMVNRDIYPDPKVNGYSGKVIALVSEHCLSACDQQAALLSRSHRGILAGTPTNGTGLGFNGPSTLYQWADWHGLITVKIPGELFGVVTKPFGNDLKSHILDFDQFQDELITENRPTLPDVPFEPSLDDSLGKGNGWAVQISRILKNDSVN
jgi:hypothetical protein